jgi:polysaccharide biosynthesis transport protein
MNRDLALTNPDSGWPVQPYDPAIAQQQDMAAALDLPALLRIAREWRWLILAAVASGLVLAIVYTMVTTPMYRAWVILQVNPPTVQIMDERQADIGEGQSSRDFVATQVGLLSSRSLAERVAQDLNLANNPNFVPQEGDAGVRLQYAAQRVADNLNIVRPDEGQLIRFSYQSESPVLSAQIANALAEAFINSNLQRRYESSAYARNFLERQIAKTRADLELSERQLVTYAQAQGIINTGSSESSNPLASDANSPQGESLSEINRALAAATAQRVAAEGAYRAGSSSGVTSTETASSQQLRQARSALEADYQQKRTLMKPEHPQMLSLRSQIAELDRQIARENTDVASGRINALRNDYQAALGAERALQSRVSQLKSDVLDLRGRSIRYATLQRDVDTNRALYDALLQRYKEIGVAGGIGTAPVSIVDRADPPNEPFKPSLPLNLVVGLALGFMLGMLAAIALEFLNDTIKTREDVRKKLGLACLGTVPKRPAKGEFVDDLRDPTSVISEAYSTVAASLGFSTETGARPRRVFRSRPIVLHKGCSCEPWHRTCPRLPMSRSGPSQSKGRGLERAYPVVPCGGLCSACHRARRKLAGHVDQPGAAATWDCPDRLGGDCPTGGRVEWRVAILASASGCGATCRVTPPRSAAARTLDQASRTRPDRRRLPADRLPAASAAFVADTVPVGDDIVRRHSGDRGTCRGGEASAEPAVDRDCNPHRNSGRRASRRVAGCGRPRFLGLFVPLTNVGAVGFFANKNHMATLLLVAIPMAAALVASAKSQKRSANMGRYGVAAAMTGLLVIGIALNGSLAATALALPVLVASRSAPAGPRALDPACPSCGVARHGRGSGAPRNQSGDRWSGDRCSYLDLLAHGNLDDNHSSDPGQLPGRDRSRLVRPGLSAVRRPACGHDRICQSRAQRLSPNRPRARRCGPSSAGDLPFMVGGGCGSYLAIADEHAIRPGSDDSHRHRPCSQRC